VVPASFLSMQFLLPIFLETPSRCLLYVSCLSRVTPRYFGFSSVGNAVPSIFIFSLLWASLLLRWNTVETDFVVFIQRYQLLKYFFIADKSSLNVLSSYSYETDW